jgi:hypothetical protein
VITQAEQDKRSASERAAFVQWLYRQTYGEAERHYHEGTVSEDAWLCYRILWTFSAARFSGLADEPRRIVHDACKAC